MSALGERFSALVAIQAGHELVTDGVYKVVRHPSYLGSLLAIAGWALLFRSAVGLLLVAAGWNLLVSVGAPLVVDDLLSTSPSRSTACHGNDGRDAPLTDPEGDGSRKSRSTAAHTTVA
jgi:Isoprenylcysteine carboxyl methyltransferase (ICMT) family